ncbi:hypothetical protein [Nonomuraea sp. NEAU-A123]|uniref:hypothetical protein n=1 Tax=Nonomuraea sp. NEAU-A123 TaxID=2839649 RepID=UPI001BE4956B|nr:hypothetical protein [Nonomuraea sp. NEAU-A123]MBT2225726.1 hypothetical protein [Nonomuraea sp. NEAU-A123]
MDDRLSKPEIFTADEIRRYRADIAGVREPGAYEPGRWSVSPLNRAPEIVGPMPSRVRLRDVTLRAIDALPGVGVDPQAKRAFLRRLVHAGVPEVVTAGARGRSAEDLRADIETIKSEDPRCRTTCPMVLDRDDLAAPAAAGYDAVQIWVPPWGEASRIYEGSVHTSAWNGADWRKPGLPRDRDGFVRRAAELIERARECGLEVTAPLLMVSYLTAERLGETCATLADAGADEIALFDGPGGMGPEAIAQLVGLVKLAAPQVRVGVHPHNSFGLAVANAIAAARAGAEVIEVSVNGYCGGPGNADLASTVAACEALYGVRTGVRAGQLKALSRAGVDLTGYDIAHNHPITGDKVYNWGGLDFMTQETIVDELLHNAIAPSWSGGHLRVSLTQASGPFTMWDKLAELGLRLPVAQVAAVLERCKAEMARLGRLLNDDEIIAVARRATLTEVDPR